MSRSYKHIRRDKARAYPRQVRRTPSSDTEAPRMGVVHEGDERLGDDVGVWGFKCQVQAAALQDWSTRCGIDWRIAPEQQANRPPPPAEDKGQLYGPIKMMG